MKMFDSEHILNILDFASVKAIGTVAFINLLATILSMEEIFTTDNDVELAAV